MNNEHPALFSASMIIAILENRKFQTRRTIVLPNGMSSPSKDEVFEMDRRLIGGSITGKWVPWPFAISNKTGCLAAITCPYGEAGDKLFARETWECRNVGGRVPLYQIRYAADGYTRMATPAEVLRKRKDRTYPSIFLPKGLSRLWLGVQEIRVQRVQDITAEDAIAEGLKAITKDGKTFKYGIPDRDGLPGSDDLGWDWQDWQEDPVAAYARLWDSINKDRGCGWDENPYVWAVTFNPIVACA